MALTQVDQGLLGTYAQYTGFKNRLINSAMVIDQRNAGASVTPANGASTYTLDRWSFYVSQASKLTTQQSSTAPTGFVNSLLVTSSSAYSVGAGDIFEVRQFVEGYNTADLMWGTANAQTVTLSFWVRSSLTGTFGGAIRNSASDRSYVFSYSISSANTWEQKTVTITGDTSGTWLTTTGRGIGIFFSLGAGSTALKAAGSWGAGEYEGVTGQTNLVGTNGATFYITGVQLEKGSTATSFDYRPYGTELALCQRYYNKFNFGDYGAINGFVDNSTNAIFYYQYPVQMRTYPTLSTTGTASNYAVRSAANIPALTSVPAITGNGSNCTTRIQAVVASGLTAGQGAGLISASSTDGLWLGFSAEL
jgi:hypothetical protein